jgi:hypothetical protein
MVTYAECMLDPLGQPVLRFNDWGPAGDTPRFDWSGIGSDFIR